MNDTRRLNELQDDLELMKKKYSILSKTFMDSNDKYLKLNDRGIKSENNKHESVS